MAQTLAPFETSTFPSMLLWLAIAVASYVAETGDVSVLALEIAIGPEGGFSPDELQACQLTGFQRIGLGPRILRTETAAVVVCALLLYEAGDLG